MNITTFRHNLEEVRSLIEGKAAKEHKFTPIWSPWIIAELNRVLTWTWIDTPHKKIMPGDLSVESRQACSDAAKEMMEHLIAYFIAVDPRPPYPPAWASLKDPWDLPIWAAAKLANAQYVVSENTRHFPPCQPDGLHIHEGIVYVRAQNFLDLVN
jgi:hypothetical protein